MRALLFGAAGCVLLLGLFVLFKPGNPPAPAATTPAAASAAAPAMHKFELKVANKKKKQQQKFLGSFALISASKPLRKKNFMLKMQLTILFFIIHY